MVPIGGIFGWDGRHTIRANTVLRNQPYAGRNISAPLLKVNPITKAVGPC
jgi:hypothetical protein